MRRSADYFRVQWVSVRVATVALFVVGLALGTSPVTAAGDADAAELVLLINASRAEAGLDPLAVDETLLDFARDHTERMLREGTVFHSARDVRIASAPLGWKRLGENVGMGASLEGLHSAFMESAGHRNNILGDYTHVAVAAARGDCDRLFVTAVFVKHSVAPAVRVAAATPPPESRPAPVPAPSFPR